MKEKLYTIPVNEAFDEETECPVCSMVNALDEWGVDFIIGPSASYMQDDVRLATDKIGFCDKHIRKMKEKGNSLGMALMLKTHADLVINEVHRLPKDIPSGTGLFEKKKGVSKATEYLENLSKKCYVCDKVNDSFDRYIETVFYLYDTDDGFREKFKKSKGFCNCHYALLMHMAPEQLGKEKAKEFVGVVSGIYIENMERVRDDLSWFIDKFDYRYRDEPWKNSRDAIQRMMMKQNSVYYKDETGRN